MSYQSTPNRPSVTAGQSRFAKVPGESIQRSTLDRTNGRKMTMQSGFLTPWWVDEALPGDTFNVKVATFVRLATPLRPVLDNLFLDFFFFAVPNRLLWENWKRMQGEQDKPGDSTDFLVPQVQFPVGGYAFESVYDYMGIPPGVELMVNALPLRAHNKIYNEWFRDQNLQDPLVENIDDGPDPDTDYFLSRRGKRHDYITSCLPFPQKGPSVQLPLGTSAPVVADSTNLPKFGKDVTLNSALYWRGGTPDADFAANNPGSTEIMRWWEPSLEADLTNATSATINAIREAFQLQRVYERDARGGSRYVEQIKSQFGVVSPDFRQQRAEYLGGGSQQITFAPVPVTAPGTIFNPVGTLGAFAQSSSNGGGFQKSFTEHCTLLGYVALRADLNYQDGLSRMWKRRTRFDYAMPVLAGLGEQEVLNSEVFAQGTSVDDDVFGYQERYAEYRYKPSEICGQFRSKHPLSLDIWHLAQDFATLPTLSGAFIEDTPPLDRILAVDDAPQLLVDARFSATVARPLPVYGVPGGMDRL